MFHNITVREYVDTEVRLRDGMPYSAKPIDPAAMPLRAGFDVHYPKGAPMLQRALWHKHRQDYNCYAYALRLMRHGWAEPGQLRRHFSQSVERWNAKRLDIFIRHDGLERIAPHSGSRGDHIIAAFLARGGSDIGADYHFYSYDSNGLWSHKPGHTKVSRTDDSGMLIRDVMAADRDNMLHNYDECVGFYRLPKDGIVYRVKPEFAHLPR